MRPAKQFLYSIFPGNQPDKTSVALLITCFLMGIASAFTVPVMSLFLSQSVQVRPIYIGQFFVIMTLSGVLISQGIAWFSDKGIDRKKLILFANLMGTIGFLIFAFSRQYWVLVASAAIFISASSAAMPQVFALAREILDKQNRPSMQFNNILRAQISLGWVIGPPIAFFLADSFGFVFLFSLAALMFLLLLIVVAIFIPAQPIKYVKSESDTPAALDSLWRDKHIVFLSLAFLLMYAGNNMYLISMPLYMTHTLGLDSSFAGSLMGTAAFIEIPIMLIIGKYVSQFGKKRLINLSILCGVLFYIGVLLNTTPAIFLFLQLFNGVFIGVTAALGIAYFQDLKPSKMGQVTTLYTNAIKTGGIIGSACAGVIADFASLHDVFFAALAVVILSYVSMQLVKDVDKPE